MGRVRGVLPRWALRLWLLSLSARLSRLICVVAVSARPFFLGPNAIRRGHSSVCVSTRGLAVGLLALSGGGESAGASVCARTSARVSALSSSLEIPGFGMAKLHGSSLSNS